MWLSGRDDRELTVTRGVVGRNGRRKGLAALGNQSSQRWSVQGLLVASQCELRGNGALARKASPRSGRNSRRARRSKIIHGGNSLAIACKVSMNAL